MIKIGWIPFLEMWGREVVSEGTVSWVDETIVESYHLGQTMAVPAPGAGRSLPWLLQLRISIATISGAPLGG